MTPGEQGREGVAGQAEREPVVDKTEREPVVDKTEREHSERPWGSYTVLDEGPGYKVKRIEVLPARRLSYQRHAHRTEHWFVVRGTGTVVLDGYEIDVGVGDAVEIPLGAAHRAHNRGSGVLVFIEVAHGGYLGEDDIVRLEDDFGRAPGG